MRGFLIMGLGVVAVYVRDDMQSPKSLKDVGATSKYWRISPGVDDLAL